MFLQKKVLKFNRKKISEERGNFELNFELDTNEKKARKTFFFLLQTNKSCVKCKKVSFAVQDFSSDERSKEEINSAIVLYCGEAREGGRPKYKTVFVFLHVKTFRLEKYLLEEGRVRSIDSEAFSMAINIFAILPQRMEDDA